MAQLFDHGNLGTVGTGHKNVFTKKLPIPVPRSPRIQRTLIWVPLESHLIPPLHPANASVFRLIRIKESKVLGERHRK